MTHRFSCIANVAIALAVFSFIGCWGCGLAPQSLCAQDAAHDPPVQGFAAPRGDAVSREVREIYENGLRYLAKTQAADGGWQSGQSGPGTNGLALLAFLASGEDPNYGPYRATIRKSVRRIIISQHKQTGYIGPTMYHHGFAMLALCEAYGAVNEADLWVGESHQNQRSICEALELGVRCAITSQKKNPFGAWRYSPDAQDADTSVSGSILMGLLAARNAGIEVPDESIDKAVKYFSSMTSSGGGSRVLGGRGRSWRFTSPILDRVSRICDRKSEKIYRSTSLQ